MNLVPNNARFKRKKKRPGPTRDDKCYKCGGRGHW